MLEIIEKIFIFLINQKCEIQLTLINLHPNEYNPFAVKLGKCVWSCDTLNDLSDKACAPNKIYIWIYMFLIWLQENMNQKF